MCVGVSHPLLLLPTKTCYHSLHSGVGAVVAVSPPHRVSIFAYVDGKKTVSFILLMRFFCTSQFAFSFSLVARGGWPKLLPESAVGQTNRKTVAIQSSLENEGCCCAFFNVDDATLMCLSLCAGSLGDWWWVGKRVSYARENHLMASTFLNRA